MLNILWIVTISVLVTVAIGVSLVFSQWPKNDVTKSGGLAFQQLLERERTVMPDPTPVAMRDGYEMWVRDYGPKDGSQNGPQNGPLIVLIHGSGWNGLQFDRLAADLSDQGHVLVPDLRRHGAYPGLRGDIPKMGQFEDDLHDLIATFRQDGQKVVMLGHSSGGGLVVRYAGGSYGTDLDGAVLLAPFLKHNAPTTRENSGGWAQPLVRRLIGLSILNTLQITGLNGMTVITFNFPPEVLNGPNAHLATAAYSYRLNTSYAPRNKYLKDVAALPRFLLVAGTEDEAFVAQEYEPLMSGVTDQGQYQLVPGQTHLDIVDAPETARAVKQFLDGI